MTKLIKNALGVESWKGDWKTVKGLSKKVNTDLENILQKNFQSPGMNGDKSNSITILYTDFYENTPVVDMAIDYSRYPMWEPSKPVTSE